jgi:hypothetical protein
VLPAPPTGERCARTNWQARSGLPIWLARGYVSDETMTPMRALAQRLTDGDYRPCGRPSSPGGPGLATTFGEPVAAGLPGLLRARRRRRPEAAAVASATLGEGRQRGTPGPRLRCGR